MPDERDEIRARLASLEARVAALEPTTLIMATPEHMCVLGYPDSSECTGASLHRRRQGCQGEACKAKSSEYYRERRVRVALNHADE
jgi:hypothetical protein